MSNTESLLNVLEAEVAKGNTEFLLDAIGAIGDGAAKRKELLSERMRFGEVHGCTLDALEAAEQADPTIQLADAIWRFVNRG